jgi:hypothetical protein
MKKAALLGLLLIPGVALAAGNVSDKPDKKHDGLICRDVAETGSRLSSQRVCMTKDQWEASRRDARQAVDQAQTRQNNIKGY